MVMQNKKQGGNIVPTKNMDTGAGDRDMRSEEMENEIKKAIREAMATTDPRAQALWKRIAPDGKEPSVEEFLDFCVNRLKEKNKTKLS